MKVRQQKQVRNEKKDEKTYTTHIAIFWPYHQNGLQHMAVSTVLSTTQ